MKKILTAIFFTLVMVISLMSINCDTVNAKSSYVDNFNTDVYIDPDGSAKIQQSIRFYVHGNQKQFSFSQRFPDSVKTNGAKPKVTFYDGNNELPLHYGSGKDNTYDTIAGNGLVAVEVYHTINDGFATGKYNYSVKDLVVNYKDIAEVNWRLIGSDWKIPFNKIRITYHLPSGSKNDLHAYEKGPTNYNIKINHKNNSISFFIKKVSAQQLLDTRILFPNSITYANKNVISKNAKAKIIHQEEQYAHEQAVKHGIFYAIGIAMILVIVAWYFVLLRNIYRNPYKKDYTLSQYLHWFKTPDFGPSKTKLLLKQQSFADFSCFVAELLVQIDQGHLRMITKGQSVKIQRIDSVRDDLINYLLNRVGDSQKVNSSDIQKFSDDQLYLEYRNWIVQKSNGKNHFIEPVSINYRHSLANISLFTSFFAVIELILAAFLYPAAVFPMAFITLGILIVSWSVFGLFDRYGKCLTKSGKNIMAELNAFEKVLSDPEKVQNSITNGNITIENILPYVIALQKQSIIDLDDFADDRKQLALLVTAFQKNPVFKKHHISI